MAFCMPIARDTNSSAASAVHGPRSIHAENEAQKFAGQHNRKPDHCLDGDA